MAHARLSSLRMHSSDQVPIDVTLYVEPYVAFDEGADV